MSTAERHSGNRRSVTGDLWARWVANEDLRDANERRSLGKRFQSKYPGLGWALFGLSVLYFVVQVLVSLVWKPSYSWLQNSISSLGDTSCAATLCSPRHVWMNSEFFVLGGIMAAGSWLIFQEFTGRTASERLAARIGFVFLAIAGAGSMLVGGFPENTVSYMHVAGAVLAIGVGTAGIWVLGLKLPLPGWHWLRWGMRVIPPFAIIAGALFAFHVHLEIGAGTMERLAAYPETIWLFLFAIFISKQHRHAKAHSNVSG
jgi:hypothetical membrane protein